MGQVNIADLVRVRQNKLIEDRTNTEREVNAFFQSLERIEDEELKVKLGVVPGRTCRDAMPSMWEEDFDVEKYKTERERMIKYINSVQQVLMTFNLEALKCLS